MTRNGKIYWKSALFALNSCAGGFRPHTGGSFFFDNDNPHVLGGDARVAGGGATDRYSTFLTKKQLNAIMALTNQ